MQNFKYLEILTFTPSKTISFNQIHSISQTRTIKKYQIQLYTSLKTKFRKELNYISQTKTNIIIQLIGN